MIALVDPANRVFGLKVVTASDVPLSWACR
jgi:hypothetical protein